MIKGADKGSAYGRERIILKKQKINLKIPIYMKMSQTTENICKRGDVCTDTLNYFSIKDVKFAGFYLVSKIHKRIYNVPWRPIISNCGYYTESIMT